MLSGNRERISGSKKNVIDVLTPRQYHEAIENRKYSLKW